MSPDVSQPLARLVHVSDWHITKPPRNPLQYLSKRLLAYGAGWVNAQRRFEATHLTLFLEELARLQPTHLILSGDLTTSGLESELIEADRILEQAKAHVQHLLIIPGNHDVYTERKRQEGIYRWIARWTSDEIANSLFDQRLAICQAGPIELLLLDQTRPTPWGSARGIFDPTQQALLESKLSSKDCVVVGHYPIHPLHRKSQEMEGFERLAHSLQGHPDSLYLHGHCHQQHLVDERFYGYPVCLDAGSLCHSQHSSFNLIDLFPSSYRVELKAFDSQRGWQTIQSAIWKRSSPAACN